MARARTERRQQCLKQLEAYSLRQIGRKILRSGLNRLWFHSIVYAKPQQHAAVVDFLSLRAVPSLSWQTIGLISIQIPLASCVEEHARESEPLWSV
jgi:hypothetical protein